jgi:hypothetical protein
MKGRLNQAGEDTKNTIYKLLKALLKEVLQKINSQKQRLTLLMKN